MNLRLDLAGDAAAGISIPFVILLLCWILTIFGRVRIARRHTDVWGRLIDKLDAASIAALVNEGEGRTFNALLTGPERPHDRIILAAQGAAMLLPLGLVLLAYSIAAAGVPRIVGVLILALAVGLASAAGVGYWLSRQWGLLDRVNARVSRTAE